VESDDTDTEEDEDEEELDKSGTFEFESEIIGTTLVIGAPEELDEELLLVLKILNKDCNELTADAIGSIGAALPVLIEDSLVELPELPAANTDNNVVILANLLEISTGSILVIVGQGFDG